MANCICDEIFLSWYAITGALKRNEGRKNIYISLSSHGNNKNKDVTEQNVNICYLQPASNRHPDVDVRLLDRFYPTGWEESTQTLYMSCDILLDLWNWLGYLHTLRKYSDKLALNNRVVSVKKNESLKYLLQEWSNCSNVYSSEFERMLRNSPLTVGWMNLRYQPIPD